MLPLLILATLGQTSRPLETWHIKCPQGHGVTIRGYLDGDTFHAFFPMGRPAPQPAVGASRNYGVSHEKFPERQGREWHGGNVDFKTAVGASGEKPNRVHVTFIGNQVEREAARKDLEQNPEFQRIAAEMGDGLAVQDYGPENPLVAEIGLVDGGKPDIVIQQTKGGKVTYRAHKNPGSDVIVGEIRRADPRYSPERDPGGGLDLSQLLNFGTEGSPVSREHIAIGVVLGLIVLAVAKGRL